MFFGSRRCPVLLLAAVVVLFLVRFCPAKSDSDPLFDSPGLDLAHDYYYSVVLPGLDLDDDAAVHSEKLEILRELANDKGLDYVGRAGSHKYAIVLRREGGLRVVKHRSAEELEDRDGMAGELCRELSKRYDEIGYSGIQCEHLPWRRRELRGGVQDSGAESAFSSKKVSLDYLAPALRYQRSGMSKRSYWWSDQGSPDVSGSDVDRERRIISGTLNIWDPRFADQWHLFNSDVPGHDLRVASPWLEGSIIFRAP